MQDVRDRGEASVPSAESGLQTVAETRDVRWQRVKRDALAVILVLLTIPLLYSVLGIGCPIKFFTGVSCPGCGMTRAWEAVLHLDFAQAFAFHPLFLLGPLVLVLIVVEPFVPRRAFRGILIAFAVLFVGCWALRMAAFLFPTVVQLPFLEPSVITVSEPKWLEMARGVVTSLGMR